MSLLGLYTNSGSRKDFVAKAFEALTAKSSNVHIAVAFFTESDVVEKIVQGGSRVRLIVRLAYPTQATALETLLKLPEVEIRYFTDSAFHPKIYLFGDQGALVGSANLTKAAIMSNQEVVVFMSQEDSRVEELRVLFSEYWKQAKVLTPRIVQDYKEICAQYRELFNSQYKLERELLQKFGRVFAGDIIQDKIIRTKENIFLEDFRKTYQETVSAFNVIRQAYEKVGRRKISADLIPLRLEIDSFISFLRDNHCPSSEWEVTPLCGIDEQKAVLAPLIQEWHNTRWPHFEDKVVPISYPNISNVFTDRDSIQTANDDQLFDALCAAHSFHDRYRYNLGGMPTWKKAFLGANDPVKLRNSLSYLIFGDDDVEERMVNLIYNPELKIQEFGRANVQEIIGWCNKEELPVINGRTTKVIRWLGFDVSQVHE